MTLGWSAYSSIAWGTEAMSSLWPISDIVEMQKSVKISETSPASVLVSPISFKIIFPPFLNFLSDMKGEIVLQNCLSCFFTIFLKVYSHGWFSYLSNIISVPPVFLPICFTKSLEFVPGHIPGILCLSEFGIHIGYGLFRYDFWLHWSMRINNISNQWGTKPSYIANVIEYISNMKWSKRKIC